MSPPAKGRTPAKGKGKAPAKAKARPTAKLRPSPKPRPTARPRPRAGVGVASRASIDGRRPGCRRGRRAERGRDVAVPADRRLRVPVQLPHRGPGGPRRSDRLAVRAALRLAQRVRDAAGPPGGLLPLRPVRDQRALGAHLRAGHERARDDLEDAHRLGAGEGRADDGPPSGRGPHDAAHAPARRRRRRPHARARGRLSR